MQRNDWKLTPKKFGVEYNLKKWAIYSDFFLKFLRIEKGFSRSGS